MREEWRTFRPVGGQYMGVREGVREALGKAGANVMGREGEGWGFEEGMEEADVPIWAACERQRVGADIRKATGET